MTVWDALVSKCKAADVVIVAHSFGGVVVSELAAQRVCAIIVFMYVCAIIVLKCVCVVHELVYLVNAHMFLCFV